MGILSKSFWFNPTNKEAIIESDGAPGNRLIPLTDPNLANWFSSIGNLNPTLVSVGSLHDISCAWLKCPPLVSVITGLALADGSGKVEFKWINGQKAGELVDLSSQLTARAMSRLMARPNPLQTWQQFRAQQVIYKWLFGFCPVFCVRAYRGGDVLMMWNIPPNLIKIETTGKLLYQTASEGIIKKITVNANGKTDELPVEDVFFLKDNYISLAQDILPNSRVTVLQWPISNIVAAYEASNVLITKRGAIGILSNHSKDAAGPSIISDSDKQAVQEGWDKYGLKHELQQIIMTSATLSWQQISMNPKDLGLQEAIDAGNREICGVYNYPYELQPNIKGVTFANRKGANKSLYQDTVIPASGSDMQVYNEYFKLNDKNIEVSMCFDHIEVLQESQEQKAQAKKVMAEAAQTMYTSGAITLNRMREMQGEETVSGDDVYFYEKNPPKTTDNGAANQTDTGTEADQADESGD